MQRLVFLDGSTAWIFVNQVEGQRLEPQKWIPKTSEFAAAWNASGPAIAIIPHGDVDKMRALGLSFDLIHKDPRRAAIKKN